MRALVTGAGGAIGAAIVKQLLERGYEVIAQDVNEKGLEGLPSERVIKVVGDLLNEQDQQRLVEAWGNEALDSVIAAHGLGGSSPLEDLDPSFVNRVLRVNAESVATLMDLTLPALQKSQGTFVVFASQGGLRGEASNTAYSAAKFAIIGWVESLDRSSATQGVAVRALCPGCTKSPMMFGATAKFAESQGIPLEEFTAQWLSGIAVGRFGETDETASAAVYLSERGIRPTVLAVTGGEVLY